ncbi:MULTISPECIES: UDP-glucose--hexose-1-phosphate uridylyltransferase [unclassified Eubacterium (in: firmicutes)]|uniref:UDP-glucose--hexose-1-phosphate uridylyltransferase n=1 Tax=Eubacterium TaxID=1730 RepID=UPI000E47430A|nr:MULTISPECIES: UDP-glucose--hexose-1-phosphate uridylyltransferase [unclassified Eubacterium (in: firmicutes)]RGF51121.1 UDP-glucose--hexose-1-phosphate uridylyltransferase [Eubacterium sp. AF36-5BH]RHP21853.1 UDP-glucose--hexose-1-phosphate uridylyltransferase [Eubacterium sp. AF34-35BH]
MINVVIDENIKRLVQYGIDNKLIPECERIYSTNMLLEVFGKEDFSDPDVEYNLTLDEILRNLLDAAVKLNIIEDSVTYRDLFDTKIMNCITPRPGQVISTFFEKYEKSPEEATNFYYNFSTKTNYIRKSRIEKNKNWKYQCEYGNLDITINLSKPEKDPKAIAAAKNVKASSYPKCALCIENEGYAGRVNHPARQNHRVIPLTLNNSKWGFQYSPYVYYNEHCIVFNGEHTPMKIEKSTFVKLFDFVKMFPHYFLGSNADLPIVGGSILTHDHFQGGNYTFAMANAPIIKEFSVGDFHDVKCGILKWPISVIRLESENLDSLINLGNHILEVWRNYSDEEYFIFSETDGTPHNTVTLIARIKDEKYQVDIALRNNITTKEHPLGVFHPHENLHHIKKENIGLIELMGLAVLPARLNKEMDILSDYILNNKDIRSNEEIKKHADWAYNFIPKYKSITKDNINEILQQEIGKTFVKVLEDAGVYKCTPDGMKGFMKFIQQL